MNKTEKKTFQEVKYQFCNQMAEEKNPQFQVVVIEVYEESFGRTKNTSFSSDISVQCQNGYLLLLQQQKECELCDGCFCLVSLSLCPALGMPAYKCFTASWAKVKLHSSVTHCELTSNSHFNSPTISLELIHKSQFWHLKRLSVPYSHTHFTFHAQRSTICIFLRPPAQNTHTHTFAQTHSRKNNDTPIKSNSPYANANNHCKCVQ